MARLKSRASCVSCADGSSKPNHSRRSCVKPVSNPCHLESANHRPTARWSDSNSHIDRRLESDNARMPDYSIGGQQAELRAALGMSSAPSGTTQARNLEEIGERLGFGPGLPEGHLRGACKAFRPPAGLATVDPGGVWST